MFSRRNSRSTCVRLVVYDADTAMTTQTIGMQILKDYADTRFSNIFAKTKKLAKRFQPVHVRPRQSLLRKKNKGRKSRQTVPLRACATIVSLSYQTTPSGPLIHRQPRDICNCIKHTSYVAKLFDSTVQLHNKHYKISVADPDLQQYRTCSYKLHR